MENDSDQNTVNSSDLDSKSADSFDLSEDSQDSQSTESKLEGSNFIDEDSLYGVFFNEGEEEMKSFEYTKGDDTFTELYGSNENEVPEGFVVDIPDNFNPGMIEALVDTPTNKNSKQPQSRPKSQGKSTEKIKPKNKGLGR